MTELTPAGDVPIVVPGETDYVLGTQLGNTRRFLISALAEAVGAGLSFLQAGIGAQPRTLEEKEREWVSVKDFGAIGDGTNHPLSERYATLAEAQVDYPFATALTQSIDWAAFTASVYSFTAIETAVGGIVYVPYASEGYYLSDTWEIERRITVMGVNCGYQVETSGSALYWPANTTGIRCYSFVDSPNGGAADNARFINLNLSALSKDVDGMGIHATCKIHIEHVVVRSFKGHNIFINGVTGVTGNANGWSASHVHSIDSGADGFHVEGNDAQVGHATQVDCSSNDGYGFYDNSSYANVYTACHASGSGIKAYYCRNATGQGSIYIGCYTEYGSAGSNCDFDAYVTVIGGSIALEAFSGNVMYGSTAGFAFSTPTGSRFIFQRNGVEIARIDTTNKLTGLAGATYTGVANNYTQIDGGAVTVEGHVTSNQTRMSFRNPNGAVGSIQTNGSATAYNTSSDYRLKENDQPMVGALAQIMALRPITFTWRVDGTLGQGFLAHELQAIAPECVSGEKDATEIVPVMDEEGEVVDIEEVPVYQGVDHSKLVPKLVAAIQELKAEFDAYKASHP